ncbi:unnamed protein product [Blepharisma stoltei]|uniref:LITAF domain-containing protein n=1 Tax=Blepharisma stoltei TaxID=1481888 RepID=A0AAU9IFT7_9CILI|nr:unnamed protein product [Blepharisma stoltei]
MTERIFPEQESFSLSLPRPTTPTTEHINAVNFEKTRNQHTAGYPKYKRPEIFDDNATEIYPTLWLRFSQTATCIGCNKKIETKVSKKLGIGGLIAICCCTALGACCWIPCAISYFKDTIHYCPNCEMKLGCRSFI